MISMESALNEPMHSLGANSIYTLNHKKRDILFLTITLANLRRFFI